MSRKVIFALFQTIDQRQWQRLPDFFHQDIVYERPGYQPFVGLQTALSFYQQERLIACGDHTLEQVFSQHHQGMCWGSLTGISKEGQKLYTRFADIYTFKDKKIIFRRTYFYMANI